MAFGLGRDGKYLRCDGRKNRETNSSSNSGRYLRSGSFFFFAGNLPMAIRISWIMFMYRMPAKRISPASLGSTPNKRLR